jgi:hypothetical protein
MRIWSLLGMSMVALSGCGERDSGPHATEEGRVTYWEVTDSDSAVTACTDAESWAETVSGPVFSSGSYLMYRVESGGLTATGQSCETVAASSCSDSDVLWEIDGPLLTFVDEPVALDTSSACDVSMNVIWQVVDEGEIGLFTVEITFGYQESAECEDLEASIIAASQNGHGLANCTIQMEADLAFSHVD